jgi:hypothetical protein
MRDTDSVGDALALSLTGVDLLQHPYLQQLTATVNIAVRMHFA